MQEYEQTLRQVALRMDEKRLRHTLGCAEEAARLARRWGADEREAKLAALLHDVTKCLDLEAQLKLCQKYAIIPDYVQKRVEKLLHAVTGAKVAEREFGACPRICGAVRWHTTGKADMNLLEKIIYMADYIEPGRSFEGVERLRTVAYEDLDGALLLGLNMAFIEMTGKNACIHPDSLEARNWLILKGIELR